MLTFTSQKSVSAISRQKYTAGISSYTSVGTASCYLRPMTAEEASINGFQYGFAFTAIFEITVDVREGDRITIAGVDYNVRGILKHDRGFNTQYLKAVITKPENA